MKNPETETSVPIIVATGCNIDGKAYRTGSLAYVTPRDAEDMKSLRMARDATADEISRDVVAEDTRPARGTYRRRDVQAG